MKFLFTALSLAFFTAAFAQLDNLESYPKSCEVKEFKSKNGLDEYVKVKFECLGEASLDENAMKMFAWSIMPKAKYTCSNKGTYVPMKLTLMEMDGALKGIVKFQASNAYGVADVLTEYYNVDSEGNVTGL